MSRTDTPWSLPDRTIDRADEADREIRMSDFVLMALVSFRTLAVSTVPVNEIAMAVLVLLCLFRPSRGGAKLPAAVVAMGVALLGVLLYSGITNDVDWTRRFGHVAVVVGVVWAGGTGRISLRSAGAGLAAGLVAVIGLALAGIGGAYYGDRLTGYFGDPNAGAYFIVVLGILAIFFSGDRWTVRGAIAVPLIAAMLLCYSRTGLLASAFAVLWMTVGRRLGVFGGALMAAGLVWFVNNIPEDLITFGPFSNRSGSDRLRDRIIAQERLELSDIPWYGHGPGKAKVEINGLAFFFHNSYLGTRQEGGWAALLLVLGLMVFAFLRLSKQSRAGDLRAAAAQAALLATAAMAVTLGEVLLDTPVGIALALALGHASQSAARRPPDG